jgi:hypothetical protein
VDGNKLMRRLLAMLLCSACACGCGGKKENPGVNETPLPKQLQAPKEAQSADEQDSTST